jgi:hypothetical protein
MHAVIPLRSRMNWGAFYHSIFSYFEKTSLTIFLKLYTGETRTVAEMASGFKSKSLAEQIAELEDPAPRDYDPEDVDLYNRADSSEDESEHGERPDGRDHYEVVG